MSIPKALFQTLRQRAKYRCEYCHYPEILSSSPLSIDRHPANNDPQRLD